MAYFDSFVHFDKNPLLNLLVLDNPLLSASLKSFWLYQKKYEVHVKKVQEKK